MSWCSSDSARDPGVKGRERAVRTTGSLVVVAATVSVPFGREHSGQRDFVKLKAPSYQCIVLTGVS